MEKHVTVAGAMHLAVAAIGLIAIPIVLLALNGSGLAAFLAGEPAIFLLLSGIGTLVSLLIVAVSLPSLIAGIGLLGQRSWVVRAPGSPRSSTWSIHPSARSSPSIRCGFCSRAIHDR